VVAGAAVVAGAVAAVVGGGTVVVVVGAAVVVVLGAPVDGGATLRCTRPLLPQDASTTASPARAAAALRRWVVRWRIVPGPRSIRRAGGAYRLAVAVALAALAAGCGTGARASSATTAATTSTTAPPSTTTSAPTTTTAAPPPPTTVAPATTSTSAAPAAFAASVAPVTATDLGATWHAGCPVGPDQLRALSLTYWGFDGAAHTGTIVVNAAVLSAVQSVFATLYAGRFPLQEVVPESAYGGDDNAAAAADDTSGFNCRYAVAPGAPQWSVHAFGEAIDVNDVQNPYIDGSTIIPPSGAAYEDRSVVRPGMAVPGGPLVDAFAAAGWQWGGRWTDSPDYQHFSATGG
jgi:hypothetical protein